MKIGNFEVKINPGKELSDGKVVMEHGTQYTIDMQNHASLRCDAEVVVDGKEIGGFRLNAWESLSLERSPDDRGCFTFYKQGSADAKEAGIGKVSASDLGLVSILFTPEKQKIRKHSLVPRGNWENTGGMATMDCMVLPSDSPQVFSCSASSLSAGGTGLSGYSEQDFVTVPDLNLDKTQAVQIYLRLVAGEVAQELRFSQLDPQSAATASEPGLCHAWRGVDLGRAAAHQVHRCAGDQGVRRDGAAPTL